MCIFKEKNINFFNLFFYRNEQLIKKIILNNIVYNTLRGEIKICILQMIKDMKK